MGVIAIEIAIQIAIGVAIGYLSTIIINFQKKLERDNEFREQELLNLKSGILMLLRAKLDEMHSYYIEVGFVPIDKLHLFRELYEIYHSLGGNGTGTAQMNDMDDLPNICPNGRCKKHD